MNIVDRRLNPKSKSLGNRQRLLRRAKGEIREAVKDALKKRKVSEVEGSEKVVIRSKNLREPSFGLGRGVGQRDFVLPGNHDYSVGDVIQKPQKGGGSRGAKGSPDGSGEDEFAFTLTKDEFLDLFFEDLQLPNLVKAKLKDIRSSQPVRAGFSSDGPPARLSQVRTLRKSLARRIALKRPRTSEMQALEAEIVALEAAGTPTAELVAKLEELKAKRTRLECLRRSIPFIDPIDLRYRRFERIPRPTTQAVMFCLMDVSASMTEDLKELAKRFFMLLHIFLVRHYKAVDVVFIRHTTEAAEVDEDTFFNGRETGGTVISSALDVMLDVIKARYPVSDWNIYAAQASDGHNFDDDMSRCIKMLDESVLPACQYFAYIEVSPPQNSSRVPDDSIVWSGYEDLIDSNPHFAMKRVASAGDIYPVFRELFARTGAAA